MKIVVINSVGPMGSSVTSSLVEKFGYLHIPVRKVGLHDYLTGKRALDDPYYWDRLETIIREHNQVITIGGVSVKDRDSSARRLVNAELVQAELSELRKRKFNDVPELYAAGKNLYAKALVYKKSSHSPDKHIEYTVDIQRYDAHEIYSAYTKAFDKTYMITLHRDFIGWLDSMISQRFTHPNPKTRYLFVFHSAYNLYREYEDAMKQMPGLHLDFEELFIPNHPSLRTKIAEFLEEPPPDIGWENTEYDLYGKLCTFQKAFTKNDVKNRYLSDSTVKVIRRFIRGGRITIFHDIVVYGCYLLDLAIFHVRSKLNHRSVR